MWIEVTERNSFNACHWIVIPDHPDELQVVWIVYGEDPDDQYSVTSPVRLTDLPVLAEALGLAASIVAGARKRGPGLH